MTGLDPHKEDPAKWLATELLAIKDSAPLAYISILLLIDSEQDFMDYIGSQSRRDSWSAIDRALDDSHIFPASPQLNVSFHLRFEFQSSKYKQAMKGLDPRFFEDLYLDEAVQKLVRFYIQTGVGKLSAGGRVNVEVEWVEDIGDLNSAPCWSDDIDPL